MLPLQFFSQNLHFAINLFAALVFFAMFWLYFDAWSLRREVKEAWKWAGCLLLCLSFLLTGTILEGAVLAQPIFGGWTIVLAAGLQLVGYIMLIWAQVADPLTVRPHTEGVNPAPQPAPPTVAAAAQAPSIPQAPPPGTQPTPPKQQLPAFGFVGAVKITLPLGALITGYLYWRRATVGLEKHLKPVAVGFVLLAAAGLVGLSSLGSDSTNPVVYNLTAPYGWLWWLARLLLLASAIIMARWVWLYLVKRIFSQIFMVFTAMVVAVFLVTTLSFSFLLVNSIQNDTLNSLEGAANSLVYAIDGKKLETTSSAEVMSQKPEVIQAVIAKDHAALVQIAGNYLADKKLSSLMLVTSAGQVLLRAEDASRWGDSISDDPLVQRAASGVATASLVSREDALAPLIYFRSAVPIKNSQGQAVGAVIAGLTADTAFVDGIKNVTGMDVAVYSGNVRSATTLSGPDGKARFVGVKENNARVAQTVLKQGNTFKGVISLMNQPYLAVYAPLKNYDNTVTGMLLVGRPHTYVLQTAGRSIQLTFLVAVLMIILSIPPAYLAAKHISKQVR